MKALTLWQPYLAGVLHGDGWCTRLTIGLRVKDADFALVFSDALREGFGVNRPPRPDERGYWLVRAGNKRGTFDGLREYVPRGPKEQAAWLRGMFDSEGNAQLLHQPRVSPAAFSRRVAFYTTDPETADILVRRLTALKFKTLWSESKLSRGHLGTKPVIEVKLSSNRLAFARFAAEIGSSIRRKQTVLDAIPGSYQPPGHHARMQRKGVATRKARQLAGGRY